MYPRPVNPRDAFQRLANGRVFQHEVDGAGFRRDPLQSRPARSRNGMPPGVRKIGQHLGDIFAAVADIDGPVELMANLHFLGNDHDALAPGIPGGVGVSVQRFQRSAIVAFRGTLTALVRLDQFAGTKLHGDMAL